MPCFRLKVLSANGGRERQHVGMKDCRRKSRTCAAKTANSSRSWPRRSSRIAYLKKSGGLRCGGRYVRLNRGREARDHPACGGGLGSVGALYAAGAGGSPVHVLRVVLLQGALISKATRRLRNAIFGQASGTRTAPFIVLGARNVLRLPFLSVIIIGVGELIPALYSPLLCFSV